MGICSTFLCREAVGENGLSEGLGDFVLLLKNY